MLQLHVSVGNRDMLSGIAASVKELSHETQSAVMSLKETLQLFMTSVESRIAQRKTLVILYLNTVFCAVIVSVILL